MYNHNFNKSIARDYSNPNEPQATIMELFIDHNTIIQIPIIPENSIKGK
jgi:hypothetical protein